MTPEGSTLETGPILIAYDGSEHAKQAIRAAASLVSERDALVVTVWSSTAVVASAARMGLSDAVIAQGVERLDARARDEASGLAAEGSSLAQAEGLRAEPIEAVRTGTVATTIAALADDHQAGLVAVGSRGRSAVKSTFIGSVTYGLLHRTGRPVLVARDSPDVDPQRHSGPTLLCFDASASARHAIHEAARLVAGGRVLVAHVWQPVDDRTLLRSAGHPLLAPELRELVRDLNKANEQHARTVADAGAQLARAAGFDATPRAVPEQGGTWETLAHVADEERAGLIVSGSRGRSALASLVIGSVSHGLLHHVTQPLLIVPLPDDDG